jgi:hypothetical protein
VGVDVVLVRRGAKRSKWTVEDLVSDSDDIFSNACVASGTPMLGRVKPYGSLVLTSAEMGQFIDEVQRVAGNLGSEPDRDLLDGVVRVATLCSGDRATELRLEGD